MTNNDIIVPENEIYELLKYNSSDNFDKIIRHFKVIKRSDYNNKVDKIDKYDDNQNFIGNAYKYNDKLSQDYDEYTNYIIVEPFELYNKYKDYPKLTTECEEIINEDNHDNDKPISFVGKHYSSITEIKEKIDNLTENAINSYVDEIMNDETFNSAEANEMQNIDSVIINYEFFKNLYIRMAPEKSKKEELIKRILTFNNIGMDLDLALNDGIPVFNDNIIYSNKKYNMIHNKLSENKMI